MVNEKLYVIYRGPDHTDQAATSFAIFPPNRDNLTPDYLESHGVKDGVRDFTPQVGRFSRERRAGSHIFPETQRVEQPTLRSAIVNLLTELELRENQLFVESLGWTVGRTPGSRWAREEMRKLCRKRFESRIPK